MKTQPTGPFLGINNRLPDFALATKNGRWLREAENVDITNSGNVVRRKATALVQAMTSPHSLFNGFLVRASMLYAVTLPAYTETLVKVLSSDAPMSYCEYNGATYYSNGTDSGKIIDGAWYPMGMETPDAPTATVIAGTLFAGKYQIAVSYSNATTGEEGGISASSNYELASDGGLRVTLPGSSPGATHVNVYVSTVNGSIPMLHSTVAASTATLDVTTNATGREANQRFEQPLPSGSRLFVFNGRLCSVVGTDLFYGVPYRLGYYVEVEGQITFPESISTAVGNQLGCYVAADKTYWLQGSDLGAVEIVRTVFPYGAVPGTEFQVPHKALVGWFGEKGVVLAGADGQAEAVMEDAVDVVPLKSGTSTVFETRGYRRVVSCGWCVNIENRAATTYVDWEFTSTSDGYGTTPDGVYALESDGKIDAHISLGKENFGVENLKHMPAAYLGVASDEPMLLRVEIPTGDYYDYEARSSDTSLMVQRVDTGRGLRENWFGLSVYNVEGSDFTLASISFAPVAAGRRI